MQDLNITIVQANQVWENKLDNLKNYEKLLQTINQTDLLVLPEMFNTGFTMNTELKEEMGKSKSIEWLKAVSKKYKCAIYTSLIIEENREIFNRGVFLDRGNLVASYDKRQTFGLAKEDRFYSSGKSNTIVTLKGWKIALQICYDLRFPENIRNKIINGSPNYDLLLYVANWPEKRDKHWKSLLTARAIENQCYTVGVNRVGTDQNNLKYSGDSTLINANGDRIIEISGVEQVKQAVISGKELINLREKLPFLKDRTVYF